MASDASDTVTAPVENGIVIEYMDESTNSRHVEKHTTARTVGDFIRVEKLSENATISVNDIIASEDGSTPISAGDTVTVVTGNKTGGIGTQKRKATQSRGFAVQLPATTNGIAYDPHVRVVCQTKTVYNGKKQVFTILEGIEMPTRLLRESKYPFHLLEPGQCFNVPVQQKLTISAAMRNFVKRNSHVTLQGRTHVLYNKTVFGIWRTV